MGDFKDILEDNKERLGQFLDLSVDRDFQPDAEPPPPTAIHCPVCLSVFYSDDSIEDHIRQVHGQQHVYLRVNANIVREVAWQQGGIRSLAVVVLGHPRATIQVKVGPCITTLTVAGETDLGQYVPRDFEGELLIEVLPEGGKRQTFTIYSRSLPEFHQDELDRQIWSLHQAFSRDRAIPSLIPWREACSIGRQLSRLENRYLDGFFEYTLGFALEINSDMEGAKECYGVLRYNPCFGVEAEEFLDHG
ncbi:MAG: hypothetical protein HY650_07465 [Acidobacteria bacterium]|nr:hypothetical protein [Acidobacteriota bacterium]